MTEQSANLTTRITVGLTRKVDGELNALVEESGLTKTDLVNRAVTLYRFVTAQDGVGRELLVRDRQTGETSLLHLL